jgi:protein-tyrosine-phosphatase
MSLPMLAGAFVFLLAAPPAAVDRPATVVFVCQHGNVKSLIAAQWFNRLAAERGIAARAVARGLEPENSVPPAIADRLRRDGLDVRGYEARPLVSADVEGAQQLVAIGVEAPAWVARSGVAVDAWDGIPPASERYEESRDAMRARIDVLLQSLKTSKPRR